MTNIEVFKTELAKIKDFRKPQGKRYQLHNILTLMVLGILSGCDDYEAMALFCRTKAEFLRSHGLMDEKNMPSHDLFRYIMMHLDKTVFSHLLCAWLESIEIPLIDNQNLEKRMIHVDGKVLRATRTSEHSRTGLLVLNAYCSDTHITIGELLVEKKSCEKTAIPEIIKTLHLSDAVVTIDAAGTMKHVAAAIVDKGGDYILALKKNNKHFFNEVSDFFKHFPDTSLIKDVSQSVDKQGLRTDTRTCSLITDLRFFSDAPDWKNLKTLVHLKSQRTLNGKTTVEDRFYLTSLQHDAESLLSGIRRHWTVENSLHWQLDVAFNEDKLRLREKNAALCMAVLRRFALAIFKKSDSKESIKAQRLAVAWSENTLLKLLNNNNLQIS